mmetsp:Transcript_7128/g.23991  ORF Transcript_7128/g.23991 Transcript_7128/m.23991 type:complete len:309 (+) Transcript_7128:918-1844(+)
MEARRGRGHVRQLQGREAHHFHAAPPRAAVPRQQDPPQQPHQQHPGQDPGQLRRRRGRSHARHGGLRQRDQRHQRLRGEARRGAHAARRLLPPRHYTRHRHGRCSQPRHRARGAAGVPGGVPHRGRGVHHGHHGRAHARGVHRRPRHRRGPGHGPGDTHHSAGLPPPHGDAGRAAALAAGALMAGEGGKTRRRHDSRCRFESLLVGGCGAAVGRRRRRRRRLWARPRYSSHSAASLRSSSDEPTRGCATDMIITLPQRGHSPARYPSSSAWAYSYCVSARLSSSLAREAMALVRSSSLSTALRCLASR